MTILEVTSRDFRDKQKAYFDMVDQGQKIIIKRGKKRAYMLIPIESDDISIDISPKFEAKIEKAMLDLKKGRVTVVKTEDELDRYLASL